MKVNPIGVQSYEQLNRRDSQTAQQVSDDQRLKRGDQQMTITPQSEQQESASSVKMRLGNYADYLSPEEKNALDLLFSRFSESGRFGASYQADTSAQGNPQGIGTVIDVKV